ncbi:hypothetical protein [Novosphingobium sp. 9]|uniref:hypothetical protein n=1 Tax=Novosphingobium sp. 9 TaxID=2025349 RepID=UPI0021B58E7A|nr:hypothetical protein [Novosphingobium sp. 9]
MKLVRHWIDPHKDDLYEAEHAFCLSELPTDASLFIHLTPAGMNREPEFTCQYIPIRKNS